MLLEGPNNWFACPQPNPGAETRLFLFPYAGGGPAAFSKWPADLPSTIETWIAHYPGRGSRHKDPPISRLVTLADKLVQAIGPHLDKPFAFFGHSFGGLVAFELARRLCHQNLPQPDILFVSACGAPHLPDPHPPIHELPDAEFLESLQAFNGIPAEVADQPELIGLLLPALRADFEAVENYVYMSNTSSLRCPIFVFGGLEDPHVSRERLEAWDSHTGSSFKLKYFPGDHFFINRFKEAILQAVAREIILSTKRKHKHV
jgi:medium-chain acyl-[acyl-carrier-protein] hydrolase